MNSKRTAPAIMDDDDNADFDDENMALAAIQEYVSYLKRYYPYYYIETI